MLLLKFILPYVYQCLPAFTYVCDTQMYLFDSLELGLQMDAGNLGPVQEQQVFSVTESSFQHQGTI